MTLGRYSMGTFMPGARISQAHGTSRPVDPATGARDALAFAMYHPAAALRTPEIERTSYADMASVPATLLASRARREQHEPAGAPAEPATAAGHRVRRRRAEDRPDRDPGGRGRTPSWTSKLDPSPQTAPQLGLS